MSDAEVAERQAGLERFALYGDFCSDEPLEEPEYTKSDLDQLVESRLMSPKEAARLRPSARDDE